MVPGREALVWAPFPVALEPQGFRRLQTPITGCPQGGGRGQAQGMGIKSLRVRKGGGYKRRLGKAQNPSGGEWVLREGGKHIPL